MCRRLGEKRIPYCKEHVTQKEPCLECENAALKAEVARLVGQLAGCGVAALQDTEESRKERIDRGNPYWSASYGDVCRRVDECIRLRAEVERLRKLCGLAANKLKWVDLSDGGSGFVESLRAAERGEKSGQ